MSIHEKLDERLENYHEKCYECGSYALTRVTGALYSGLLDDILGVRNPTIDDVRTETYRVYRDGYRADLGASKVHVVLKKTTFKPGTSQGDFLFPSVAAAYGALRAMPDYEPT